MSSIVTLEGGALDELKLADYFAGMHREDIEARRLDAALAGILGMAAGTVVWLSDWTLTKIRFRHAEINFQHYLKIPVILREGFARRGRKGLGLEIYWLDGWTSAAHGFCLCMKRTAKNDLFITTLIHFSEVRRKYRGAERRGQLVRPLKAELALRLMRGASQV